MPTSPNPSVRGESTSVLGNVKLFFFLTAVTGAAFSISLCGVGVAGLAAAILAEFLLTGGHTRPRFPHWPVFVALIASLLVSVVISDYLRVSLRGFLKYVDSFILLYGGIDVMKDRSKLRTVVWAFLTLGAVLAIDGAIQHFFGRDLFRGRTAIPYQGDILRITGPFKHSNDYATFLVPAFALWMGALAEALRTRSVPKGALAAAALGVMTFAVMRSMSRSALIAVCASVAVLALFSKQRVWIFSALGTALALIFFIPSDVSTRLHELFNWQAGNMPERLILLKTTAAMTAANPWFGLGLNTYSDHFARFRPANYHDIMYAHNSFLQMASECGLVGLGLYLGLIGLFLKDLWSGVRRAADPALAAWGAAIFAAAFGYLVNAGFESCLQSTQLRTLFWAVMGVAAGTAHRLLQPSRASRPEKALK